MQKIRMVVAYDGTDFHGWQIQPQSVSVASTLEKSFKKVFGENVSVVGASRTDAGVHALGQVAYVATELPLTAERIRTAWNGALPNSIHIRAAQTVADDYHPSKNVVQKTYLYHLFTKRPLPIVARYGWHYGFIHQVDWYKFNQCLQVFVGQHDFTALCRLEDGKDPVRTIDAISLIPYRSHGIVQVKIMGKSFLRYQIRRMIGYSLDIARRPDFSVDFLRDVLASKNAEQQLVQADASGLCLRKIVYKLDK